ncbi:MAG: hypothetical protein DCC55_19615 [Chloroflexi bacterium]|nr:MAG: hypothetical protein DCC55_19615 [Chloroflexota bacterium]
MARLSLSVLGGFQVKVNGEPITAFESNKVRALLAYLAVEADRPHDRPALAGLLWPDHPETAARTNLRHVLRQLRQTLPDTDPAQPLLLTSSRTLQFNIHSSYTLDVAQFGELLAASERCSHRSLADCPACLDRYTQAAALYQGDFLAGLALYDSDLFEEWVEVQRERLRRQALELFFTLATHHEKQGAWEPAQHYAWKQLEVEPWREEAHRQLMRVLAQSGQRSAALSQYERCRSILADELGVEPEQETMALYEQIRAGGWGSRGVGALGGEKGTPSPSTSPSPCPPTRLG